MATTGQTMTLLPKSPPTSHRSSEAPLEAWSASSPSISPYSSGCDTDAMPRATRRRVPSISPPARTSSTRTNPLAFKFTTTASLLWNTSNPSLRLLLRATRFTIPMTRALSLTTLSHRIPRRVLSSLPPLAQLALLHTRVSRSS
ncbi:uncharacterized protein TRAVEDRAFT_70113, partial [Trametes versicolor FP-101664 SS1]|uniref:uncharacterized protein n=1 Tax=Trametes versicolor (strain FP-101664) TaxID=717944 RepID=UPI0004624066